MVESCPKTSFLFALDLAIHTAVGAAVGTITVLNPVAGATFGALYYAGTLTADGIRHWVERNVGDAFGDHTLFVKMLKFTFVFIAGFAIASFGVPAIFGVPIAMAAGVKLGVAMLATTLAIATFVIYHAQAREVITGGNLMSALRC